MQGNIPYMDAMGNLCHYDGHICWSSGTTCQVKASKEILDRTRTAIVFWQKKCRDSTGMFQQEMFNGHLFFVGVSQMLNVLGIFYLHLSP